MLAIIIFKCQGGGRRAYVRQYITVGSAAGLAGLRQPSTPYASPTSARIVLPDNRKKMEHLIIFVYHGNGFNFVV
jgi:hypothetical protein